MQTSEAQTSTNWRLRFFAISIGQWLSWLGSGLTQFALIWWLTAQTGSATVLATASLVGMLPNILLGPFAGAIADRKDRRLIMLASDSAIALVTMALISLFASNLVQTWHVYAALFLRSVFSAFHGPSKDAAIPTLVPQSQLTRVAGLNQAIGGVVNIAAAPLGVLLLSVLPVLSALMVDVLTACCAVLPLLIFRIPQPQLQVERPKQSLLTDVWEGAVYLVSRAGLRTIVGIGLIAYFILTPVGTMMSLLVKSHFGRGPETLAIFESLFGAGLICGGLLLGAWGGFKRRILTAALGLSGFSIGIGAIALAPSDRWWLAAIGMEIFGLSNAFTNGPIFALMQAIVPADKLGRVSALLGTGAMATAPLSLAIAGPISDLIGIRVWSSFAAVVCALLVVLVASSRTMRALETSSTAEAAPHLAATTTYGESHTSVERKTLGMRDTR
jgi:DHA3 family macrolide efflux protein-like MFS transporter